VFPHHENEIAQSEGAHHGHPLAQVWMHNGFLQVEGEKMAKSAGNFYTIRELLARTPGDVLRLQMLMTHYRQPIDWTEIKTREASSIIQQWWEACGRASLPAITAAPSPDLIEALSDDLNAPEAIKVLHDRQGSALRSNEESQQFVNNLVFLGIFRDYRAEVLPFMQEALKGFKTGDPGKLHSNIFVQSMVRRIDSKPEKLQRVLDRKEEFIKYLANNQHAEEIADVDIDFVNKAIKDRSQARKLKDFAESDRIRDELLAQGIVLKDGPGGTTWEVKR
jgi:cysteinyl-tRNA synthetase